MSADNQINSVKKRNCNTGKNLNIKQLLKRKKKIPSVGSLEISPHTFKFDLNNFFSNSVKLVIKFTSIQIIWNVLKARAI